MRFRKLRIAWSVVWAFAYLLLPILNPGYDYYRTPRKYFITPQQHFLLAFPALLLIAAPWLSRRFSLRTLLIAMTLVAVSLGLIVWAMR
jgi:hypothetical protein